MISLIACVDNNLGIGFKNGLLAHIKEDLKFFKRMTKNKVVVMGLNTYLSLPVKPLPDRLNIVISHEDIELEDCLVFKSIESALLYINSLPEQEVMIIGGASIYKQFMPYADRLYLTRINRSFENVDTYFPEVDPLSWKLAGLCCKKENIKHKYPHMFATYIRR